MCSPFRNKNIEYFTYTYKFKFSNKRLLLVLVSLLCA